MSQEVMKKYAVKPGAAAFGVGNEIGLAHQIMFQLSLEFPKYGCHSDMLSYLHEKLLDKPLELPELTPPSPFLYL
jgi:hypothetical protein